MKMSQTARYFLGLGLLIAASAQADQSDAQKTLGFEDVTVWSSSTAALATNPTSSQGHYSLAATTSGYSTITSRLLGPLGPVSPATTLDVLLPPALKQAPWSGAIQLYLSIPSLNIYNRYLLDRQLAGLSTGAFTTLSFPIPQDLQTALQSGTYRDLSFTIALNLPTDQKYTILLDNLRFSASLPLDTTIGKADIGRVLDFEDASLWTVSGGQKVGLSSLNKTSMNFSLVVVPAGYTTITSAPLSSGGLITSSLTFKLFLPGGNQSLPWAGAMQAYLSSPSRNINNQYLGQVELTGVPGGQFQLFTFQVPASIVASLNASFFSDLTVKIVLNVPTNNTATYYLDEMRLGKLADDTTGYPLHWFGHDIIGEASSGTVSFTTDYDGTQHPSLPYALFEAAAKDGNCAPSATQACSFQVNTLQIYCGSFHAFTKSFSGGVLRNQSPFSITLGGTSYPPMAYIPQRTLFTFQATGSPTYFAPVFPSGTNNSLYISPAGAGKITLSATFSGNANGHTVSLSVTTTANTPLTNRPPIPAMLPPRINRIAGHPCLRRIVLDATGTSDPDNNLKRIDWFDENGSIIAFNTKASFLVTHSGTYVVSLQPVDAYGSVATLTTSVPVTLDASCP